MFPQVRIDTVLCSGELEGWVPIIFIGSFHQINTSNFGASLAVGGGSNSIQTETIIVNYNCLTSSGQMMRPPAKIPPPPQAKTKFEICKADHLKAVENVKFCD